MRRLAYTQHLATLLVGATFVVAHVGKMLGDRDSPQTHSIEYSLWQWPALRSIIADPIHLANGASVTASAGNHIREPIYHARGRPYGQDDRRTETGDLSDNRK